MSEFYLGFAFGGLIIGIILAVPLTYFGMVYWNLRRMEKTLQEQAKKQFRLDVDNDTGELLTKAEKLIAEQSKK